jgi:creatinine amidohydrolase/Fe(II)-dependent formamide hydrolase-like protein
VHEIEILTAAQLRDLIGSGLTTAIVPFGSIEHQGELLPLGADALLADAVGREVATRLDAFLLPTVRIGDATQHASRTGTLTLRPETLEAMAYELALSLEPMGLRVIAFVSTHGGNAAALQAASERLNADLADAVACAPRGFVGPDAGEHAGHWLRSVMLRLHPGLVAAKGDAKDDAIESEGAERLERFIASIVTEIRAAAGA